MGNRVIAAKVLKIKRRRFKMRTKSAGPYPGWAADYYRRVASFRKPFHPKVDEVPPTLGATRINVNGESILQRVWDELTVDFGGEKIERTIVLAQTSHEKIKLCFLSASVFLAHEDWDRKIVKKSILYPDREKAHRAYRSKRVIWVEKCSLPSPSTDL